MLRISYTTFQTDRHPTTSVSVVSAYVSLQNVIIQDIQDTVAKKKGQALNKTRARDNSDLLLLEGLLVFKKAFGTRISFYDYHKIVCLTD